MAFRLGGFLLAVCIFGTASSNLFDASSDTAHITCGLFAAWVRMFPLNIPRMEKVSFELRKPCKSTEYPIPKTNMLSASPDFDAKLKTVVIVNGWIAKPDESYTQRLLKALHCRGGVNVIVVNTSAFFKTLYVNSAHNVEKLGEFVAIGLRNLNIPGKNIHLIGHSLGAHLMGSAGRHFASQTGQKVARITGLDPARPCFKVTPVFNRLTVEDADFVDIIHSNPGDTGIEEPIGHVDFYPGGLEPTQPACFLLDVLCSHVKSMDYLTESVYKGNENNFMGSYCEAFENLSNRTCTGSQAPMGYAANKKSEGIYFLDVNTHAPYGKNAKETTNQNLNKCGVCTK